MNLFAGIAVSLRRDIGQGRRGLICRPIGKYGVDFNHRITGRGKDPFISENITQTGTRADGMKGDVREKSVILDGAIAGVWIG
ncbi:MAG: hypothetical protein Unbinned1312contig1001_13 [Prokaryotic dsDNA virus sp.]|nr:MAG: hypothetical protein Unbinned1312contig1001_13 [Prokaryotic dsDNA virus sp.]